METLIETIRVAVQSDASEEAKHQGALACRTILTALDAKPGEPLVPPRDPNAAQPSAAVAQSVPVIEPLQVAAIVGALRGMPAEQLLDLAIARLRAALPKDATTPTIAPVKFQIIPIAPLATTLGSTDRSAS